MGEQLFEILRAHFAHHGYLTLAATLLLENAGVPVPGETVLLFASFLAYSQHELQLPWIIAAGTLACTFGDNLGYLLGHHGGRPLLERYKHLFRISQRHLDKGERLFEQHGAKTVFVARFIFGMRIITGPLAGVLRMPWKQFALFNFLGAALWVTVISSVGYLFGRHWATLLRTVRTVNVSVIIVLAAIGLVLWWRHRRRQQTAAPDEREQEEQEISRRGK
jgi:membrane protein DedA with SNARE-associated domain